ncbi:hypothetical protein YC2023_094128 [Brassica napus]
MWDTYPLIPLLEMMALIGQKSRKLFKTVIFGRASQLRPIYSVGGLAQIPYILLKFLSYIRCEIFSPTKHITFLLLKLQEYLKSLVLFWFITIIRSSLQLGKILPCEVVSCQHKENSWGNVSGSMVWRRSIYGSHQ